MEKNSSAKDLSKVLLDCLTATTNLIANRNSLENQFAALKKPADKVPLLLALSGGADSTALLIALNKIAPHFGFRVSVCHINHGLRTSESDQDAQFCLDLCQQINVNCEIIKMSVGDLPKLMRQHASEDTLRELRYSLLTNFAKKKNISFLITAHTLDDQVETVLFRLFRGTAPSGLKGIEYCRKIENNIYLLRPMLKITKIQCQNFLNLEGFTFRTDSSNQNEIYSRNYIRHKIVPAISERFPDFSLHLDSLAEIADAEDNFMNKLSQQSLEQLQSGNTHIWEIKKLQEQPLALFRRVLNLALKERDIEVSFKRIDEIVSLAIGELPSAPHSLYLNLNKNWRIKRTNDELFWQNLREEVHTRHFEPIQIDIPSINVLTIINSELLIENYQENLYLHSSTAKPLQLSFDGQSIFADLSRIKLPIILRQRLPGDRIQPLGMLQLVKLKKYLHTHKAGKNHSFYPQLLLADQEEVLWLPGIGMSDKIKVINSPSHVLKWRQVLSDTV
jgi:tRNA(Ile)-lysidine synthase